MKDKESKKPLGCGFICLGIALQIIAAWDFTSTVDSPFPNWLKPFSAIGFWGWWLFVLMGIILLIRNHR
ncbi:MAG: hypothetical protein KDA57_06350 [Planctomycetales bacterium]|nr:hypothetical protein [Planctomycetales bacterium]